MFTIPHQTKHNPAGGYVLAFVLVMLLILTVLATTVLKTSVSEAAALTAAQLQTQATLNGTTGVQDVLARLRTGDIDTNTLPLCASVATCGSVVPPPVVLSGPAIPSTSTPMYRVTIFRRGRLGFDGRGSDVTRGSAIATIVISSVGVAEDNEQYTSLIEVEVDGATGTLLGNTYAGGG